MAVSASAVEGGAADGEELVAAGTATVRAGATTSAAAATADIRSSPRPLRRCCIRPSVALGLAGGRSWGGGVTAGLVVSSSPTSACKYTLRVFQGSQGCLQSVPELHDRSSTVLNGRSEMSRKPSRSAMTRCVCGILMLVSVLTLM